MALKERTRDRVPLDWAKQPYYLCPVASVQSQHFTMDWLESPELRRRCQADLNKGSRHESDYYALLRTLRCSRCTRVQPLRPNSRAKKLGRAVGG